MSHVDELELELLTGLRVALAPEPAARERVRRQLASALLLPNLPLPELDASPLSTPSGLRRFFAARATQIAAAALVSGALGGWIGYRAGSARTQTRVEQPARAAERQVPAVIASGLPTLAPNAAVAKPAVAAAAESLAKVRAMPVASINHPVESAPVEDPLLEELGLLRRAERAIRAQNGLLALGLLRELDQRFPKGQLLEERDAAKVMANCEVSERSSAQRMGAAYLERHPKSVYVERVRTLCQLATAAIGEPVTESDGSGN